MAFLVGLTIAVVVGALGRLSGMERQRAYYTTVTIVVAHYYALFAVIGASTQTLVIEALAGLVFAGAAVLGFRSSFWLVAFALAGHGVYDLFHGFIIANPGVPAFWPAFCLSFDLAAGVYLAWLLKSGRMPANHPAP
ncbi:MAG: hypothetical protein JNK75_10355 [Betaproteobacteria bacterium]|nr:hypothetical protein [Betaproteobacteria bacterium]